MFGPTVLHLQHEMYLLLALTLVTASSLSTVYKTSLGSTGDWIFVGITSLWLSRTLFIRWVSTCDNATNRSPTFIGVLSHWLTSHINGAGQYFEHPDLQVVGRQIGTSNPDDGRTGALAGGAFVPSVKFTYQFFKVKVWYPLIRLKDALHAKLDGNHSSDGDASNPQNSGNKNSNQQQHSQKAAASSVSLGSERINSGLSSVAKFWAHYGPPVQMLIPITVFMLYIWNLFFAASAPERRWTALTMNPQAAAANKNGMTADFNDDTSPHGSYQKLGRPGWSQVLLIVSCGATLASILLYGRVFLPIADLVAGSNVLKAIRNEAKSFTQQGSSKIRSRLQKESVDTSWAEQHKSIANENRFRLICKIASVRTFEHIFVCVLFPKTGYICRATGHCPEGAALWELSKVFYFSGVASSLRDDTAYQHQFGLFTSDSILTMLAIISTILISVSLFNAQAVTLDRSYLSIMGYLAGEWTIVDESDPVLASSPPPSTWDPRRKYKKGDLILQHAPGRSGQTIYKAASNSPEGRPVDVYMRASRDFFTNELGRPLSSTMIRRGGMAQMAFLGFLLAIFCSYKIMDYYSGPLLWMILANLVGLIGTLGVGMSDYSGLEQLAGELSR